MNAIDSFGLNERVCHLGYVEQDDLQAVYRLATALVMPSLFESVSIPIYEAFQVGTPVAASGILAIPEQVGDAGLLFDPKSVASIKDAILRIIKDPAGGALAWGKRARQDGGDDAGALWRSIAEFIARVAIVWLRAAMRVKIRM